MEYVGKNIKFFVMDVDGTLTDGKIYMSDSGELFKAFDIKDGCGIKEILIPAGIIPIIITARSSKILEARCRELAINDIYQDCRNKITQLEQILHSYSKRDNVAYSFANCAYVGDDLPDLQCMVPIKEAGGLVGCPNDAVQQVKNMAEFISSKCGGNGAVREFIEWIVKKEINNADIHNRRTTE